MSILNKNIIDQNQLTVDHCFRIDMSAWTRRFPRSAVASMQEVVYKKLEERYGDEDPTNNDLFPTIYNDIPELMFDYLYQLGHITAASKDYLLLETHREQPYWGIPEVPQFMVDISTHSKFHTPVCVRVSNLMWERNWKGVDPYAYHKFIGYMRDHWDRKLQFCHNPWEVLEDIITNPDKYTKYEYTM